MNKPAISLVTVDYPPDVGGLARYLGSIVAESDDWIRVLVPEGHSTGGPGFVETAHLMREAWPRWWPSVATFVEEGIASRKILVSHVFPLGTAAWIAHLIDNTEYVVICHGLDVRLVRGPWKRWLFRRICRGARACIANSQATRRDMLKIDRSLGVHVITPGVYDEFPPREEARRALGLGPDEGVVLTLSRLVPRKGVDFSIRAMSQIQTRHDVTYVVVGDGPDRDRLKRVAEESRVRVRWIHDADEEARRRWMAAADIFLLPARDEGSDVEGFGIVYLEAAMAGVPSVAGDSGGVREAVVNGETGYLVNPNRLDEIVSALERLITNPELRQKMGEVAWERAEHDFRWHDRWLRLAGRFGLSGEMLEMEKLRKSEESA